MLSDKAEAGIGKHDPRQINGLHRKAAAEKEVRKARTGKEAVTGSRNSLGHGIYAD